MYTIFETIVKVLDVLKSDDQEMQAVAIAMVREMPGTEVTKALIKEMPKLSITGQIQLLSALADRGDRTALPAVISATKAKELFVRVAALKALGQLGDASSVPLLAQTAAPVEIGHRSVTICHLGNIAMKLKRKLRWDPDKERFVNNEQANRMLSKPMRSPWHL